jgi:hypothetical protein
MAVPSLSRFANSVLASTPLRMTNSLRSCCESSGSGNPFSIRYLKELPKKLSLSANLVDVRALRTLGPTTHIEVSVLAQSRRQERPLVTRVSPEKRPSWKGATAKQVPKW